MEDAQFQDGEGYAQNYVKNQISFRDIILGHLKNISGYASVEFRGGFWEVKPPTNPHLNVEYRTYVPDTREVYSNAVECFADMLFPYFDRAMKQAEETASQEDKVVFDRNTLEVEREDKSPEEGRGYEREFAEFEDRITYRSERVKINRKLFRALCCFLYRKKYLELGTIQD